MSDQTSTTELPPPPPVPPAAPVVPRTRLRDRSLGLPLVTVVAVVALLVGGGIGAAIGYAAHSDSGSFHDRSGFGGPGGGDGQQGGPNGRFAPPNGQQAPQQQAPGTDS